MDPELVRGWSPQDIIMMLVIVILGGEKLWPYVFPKKAETRSSDALKADRKRTAEEYREELRVEKVREDALQAVLAKDGEGRYLIHGWAQAQRLQTEVAATTLVLNNLVEITHQLADKLHRNNNIMQAQVGATERIADAVEKTEDAVEKVHDSVRNIPALVAGLRSGHGSA